MNTSRIARLRKFGRGEATIWAAIFALLFASFLTPIDALAESPDFPIANGWFFTQTGGDSPDPRDGYAVIDDQEARFWEAFQAFGGVEAVGYPVSRRFIWDGFTTQAMQKVVFQWRPESDSVAFVNVLDDLHRLGFDESLEGLLIPAEEEFEEAGFSFSKVVAGRTRLLEAEPALLEAYRSVPDPLRFFGLPTSVVNAFPGLRTVRLQRAVLQLWTQDFPWAKAGQVTVANGGDVAKQLGMFPAGALAPELPDQYALIGDLLPPPLRTVTEVVADARTSVVRITGSLGSGSGFLIDSDGHVLTNAHVVGGMSELTVEYEGGQQYAATVVGFDSRHDLALLKIDVPTSTPHLMLATDINAGESVVALGFPLGLQGGMTVTTGIVSSENRTFGPVSFLQTDAAINPGNSGGPLLNLRGQVVGMNTAGFRGDVAQGIGFAIRYDQIASQLPDLLSGALAPPAPNTNPPPDQMPDAAASNFGPITVEILHDPEDGRIETGFARFNAENMWLDATFVNPKAVGDQPIDYGFILRRGGEAAPPIFIVFVTNSEWYVFAGVGSSRDLVQDGTVERFNLEAGERNRIQLAAIGGTGWLFCNGALVAELDLSAAEHSGEVAVMTGFFAGNEVAGAKTTVENFAGQALEDRYLSDGGALQEGSQTNTLWHHSGVDTRDVVAEVAFPFPSGREWSAGFAVRNSEFNRTEIVGISGNDRWYHYTREPDDEDFTLVAEGELPAPEWWETNRRIRLIAFGALGWLFVDGKPVGPLDLSHNFDRGQVSIFAGLLGGQQEPREFHIFNVWAP